MICKNCGKELPQDCLLCDGCGVPTGDLPEGEFLEEAAVTEEITVAEELEAAEETPYLEYSEAPAPKKNSNVLLIILACVAGVALLAVLAGAILYGIGINPVDLFRPKANDIRYNENYTVADDVAREKSEDVVATVGEKELTNGELQIYYWETVYNFLNTNYYYLSMYGLDPAQPLDQQPCMLAEGQSWQQYFLEMAISTWQRYNTLQILAQDAGFQLDAEMQSFLDELPKTMESNAKNYGFDSVQAWLEADCGPGVTQQGYLNYVSAYYVGSAYLSSLYEDMEPTQAEVETYFAEHETELAQAGVTKDMGKYHDVRHILIEVGGDTEEDWATCLAEAQRLHDEWKANDGTEEAFAEYAKNHSADGGSSSNGGLYEDLTSDTNFVPEFKEWYLDSSRKPGDTGLVKTTYGYHIMYYSAGEEMWPEIVAQEMLADRVSTMIDEGIEENPIDIKYKKITLGSQTL